MAPLNEVPVRIERASGKIKKTLSELKRLLELKSKARHDRIFGGFSTAEQIEYDIGKTRIHDLETELQKRRGLNRWE